MTKQVLGVGLLLASLAGCQAGARSHVLELEAQHMAGQRAEPAAPDAGAEAIDARTESRAAAPATIDATVEPGADSAAPDALDAAPQPLVDSAAPAMIDAAVEPIDAALPPAMDAAPEPVAGGGGELAAGLVAGGGGELAPGPVAGGGGEPAPEPVAGGGGAPLPVGGSGGAPLPVGGSGGAPLPEPVSGAGGELAFDAGEPADAGIPVSDAGADAGFDASTATCSGPPGLYADDACQLLGSGVQPYRPRYELWNDGATKERFIYLPSGAQIDTSNPDRWSFPLGTRIYKTFALDGVRLETRMLEKTGQAPGIDSWTLISYAWSADQRSVSPADAAGSSNVLGTSHDIPSQAQCRTCHNMPSGDAANGFGAIQLNHDDAGLTLRRLLDENWLVNGTPGAAPNVSLDSARIPGDATAQAALGYLHGNCGHCHGGPSPRANMRLWSTVGVSQLSAAPIFQTAVCQCLQRWTGRQNAAGDPYALRVAPGHAVISGVVGRMSARTAGEQMPPLGTEMVDPSGLAAVRAWIDSLDPSACDGAPPTCGTP